MQVTYIIGIVKLRRLQWAEHLTRIEETRNAYRILVGKLLGKRPLERSGARWVNNIKTDLRMLTGGWEKWVKLAQDRVQLIL
jgi:hypothetical protein